MNYILFDDANRARLLPFTHTRPVADIRCGILTMRERWERLLGAATGSLTADYLGGLFPVRGGTENTLINGGLFATRDLATAIRSLGAGEKLVHGDTLLAARMPASAALPGIRDIADTVAALSPCLYSGDIRLLGRVWDIFTFNDKAIREDFALVTEGRTSAPVPPNVTVTGSEQLFIEEGANIYAGCVINAAAGPVYIGSNTEVLEGCLVRGPLAVCDHAVIKMGAKIYGATTLGPACKVGGEINNVVFFANSNKAHDGYLGNAVVGEWCNLGADTNCSNLKNNYAEVKIWDEEAKKSVSTGLTFCGLMMGDHSKCGINTMFNTGTVVGVSCNIFGGSFPEKFIPSFSWGGSEQITRYDFNRAMETAERMMGRRNKQLTETERNVYRHIYDTIHN